MIIEYLDFDLEIGPGPGRGYPVTVRVPAGEAQATIRFPFDMLALESRLKDLQVALLVIGVVWIRHDFGPNMAGAAILAVFGIC